MNCPRCGEPGRLAGALHNGELWRCAACDVVFSRDGTACRTSELLGLVSAPSAEDEARELEELEAQWAQPPVGPADGGAG